MQKAEKTVLISFPVEDLQTLIIDCVNSCLKFSQDKQKSVAEASDQLLTIQQAAEYINLAVPTLYGLVSRAEIPVSKRGKRLYFSKQELTSWIQAGRRKTISEIQAEAENHVGSKKKRGVKP